MQFWNFNPSNFIVVGILNKAPQHKNWVARIRPIGGIFKFVVNSSNSALKECRFIIEIYMEDWRRFNKEQREWLLFHEMLHTVDPKHEGMLDHDVQEFSPILKAVGDGFWNNPVLKSLFDESVELGGGFLLQRMLMINQLHQDD